MSGLMRFWTAWKKNSREQNIFSELITDLIFISYGMMKQVQTVKYLLCLVPSSNEQ